jgi:hypothetical protein
MKKMKHSFIKSILGYRGGSLFYKQKELDAENAAIAFDALAIWMCVIRDIVCVDGDLTYEGRVTKFFKSLDGYDLFKLISHIDLASSYLLQSVEKTDTRRWKQFKAVLVDGEDELEPLGLLASLTKSNVCAWFTLRSELGFRNARQILEFPKRLTLRLEELSHVAFETWWDVETTRHPVVPDVEVQVAREWFPIEDTALIAEYFVPHHGGGAVYEGSLSNGEKYLLNGLDDTLALALTELGIEVPDQTLMQRWWLYPVSPGIGGEPATRHAKSHGEIASIRVNPPFEDATCHRVVFVPKSYKTYRTVSMEPVSYQFFEEGAAQAIFTYLRRNRVMRLRSKGLSAHYCVDTEGENRRLAQLGSIDGSYCTIDLSSASDCVTLDLVEKILGETCLFPFIHLRTKYAKFPEKEFGGDIIEVKKFAPMGSALCFPIESIVFATIVEGCVRSTPGVNKRYFVYGDDIVCDTKIAGKLLDRLTRLGFEPNVTKSFFNQGSPDADDFFRESCGGEYLNGHDVTPARLSRKFSGLSTQCLNRSLPQLISLCNDLRSFATARQLIINQLVLIEKLPILFDGEGIRGLYSPTPTNFHLDHRWNNDLQREEVFALELVTRRKQLRYNEAEYVSEVRLYEYLRLAYQSGRTQLLDPSDLVDERVDPYSTELDLVLHWTAKPDPMAICS